VVSAWPFFRRKEGERNAIAVLLKVSKW
jgi:hypothetical protein